MTAVEIGVCGGLRRIAERDIFSHLFEINTGIFGGDETEEVKVPYYSNF